MEYIVRDYNHEPHRFSFSYNELREDYIKIKQYTNEEFLENIPSILHTTIFICYLKEIPNYISLSDYGVIHELSHLLNNLELCHFSLDSFRNSWNNQLCL